MFAKQNNRKNIFLEIIAIHSYIFFNVRVRKIHGVV